MSTTGRCRPEADLPLTPPRPNLTSDRYIPELTASYWMGKSRRLTKANLAKARDAKPRVLASSEKPWKDSPKDPKTAELPKRS